MAMTLALLLGTRDWVQNIENITLDWRTLLRASDRILPKPLRQVPKADDGQLVVAIDEESMRNYGGWPWPRSVHGLFLAVVGPTKPSVITWDILFTEPSSIPDEDRKLTLGLNASGANVVFGAMLVAGKEEGMLPDAPEVKGSTLRPLLHVEGDRSRILSAPALLLAVGELSTKGKPAFVDTPPGTDGVRRRVPLIVSTGGEIYPTLSLASLMEHWHVKPEEIRVRLGAELTISNAFIKRRIPIDETGALLVNYRYTTEGFNTIPYSYLASTLDKQRYADVPPTTGRILLIGQTAEGLSDMGPTPFSPVTPLVLVHANVIDNVLREDYAHRAQWWPIWLGALIVSTGGLAIFSKRKLAAQAAFGLGTPVVYGAVAAGSWIGGSLWLPVVWPLLGFGTLQIFMIARRLIAEQRSKEQIKGMFGTYVSPALVNRMVESGESPQLGGHEDDITAYFSDIQGFSTFSEKLPPDRLVELMNEYLTVCTDIVQEEGGTLDKYIGDAVVAMFGAPISLPDHAFRACVATQRVQKKLGELRVKWESEGDKWPEIVWRMQSRIGLNSGRCIIGNMGSRTRFNYTMMGDNVNLAARMESQAKSWGVYTMCADATKLACEQHGGDRVIFRPLGQIVVMGRSKPVPFYEIVGLKEDVSAATLECLQLFSAGLQRYYARDWDGALELFARSQALEPNVPGKTPGVSSNPSLVFADLTHHYKAEPPAAGWDGVHVAKSK